MKATFCVNFVVQNTKQVRSPVFASSKLTAKQHESCDAHRLEDRRDARLLADVYDRYREISLR